MEEEEGGSQGGGGLSEGPHGDPRHTGWRAPHCV